MSIRATGPCSAFGGVRLGTRRHDQVAATIAALRRTGGGDALAETERRLHGDLAETDARWRPRIAGPRSRRAAIRPRDPAPAQGVAAAAPDRLHDAQPRQPACPASRRLGSGRRDGARLPALGGARGRAGRRGRRDPSSPIGPGCRLSDRWPADPYLEDYAWRAAAVARDERPAIIHASSGGRGYETALVGLALG